MADEPVPLPDGRFQGRDAFRQLVRDALSCAARDGWSEIILSDGSFLDWPLGERVVAESLREWSRPGRRCTLLARQYDDVRRLHPRFVTWRTTYSHLIDARAMPAGDPLDLPSAIWSPHWVLERRDVVNSVGYTGSEPQRRVLLLQTMREWLLKSSPSFPSTTLGL